jgi:hypothetical protein
VNKGDALLPLNLHSALSCAMRKVQESEEELEFNGTHQLHICADDDIIPGEDKNKKKENTEALLQASRAIYIEVNSEETKCIVMSRHQNAEQNHNLLFLNKFFENMVKFKYTRTTVTHKNCIHEEIKFRECLLSFLFRIFNPPSPRYNFKIHKTIIVAVVLYVCESCFVTQRNIV